MKGGNIVIILQAQNVTKRFGGEDLFTNVNLTVQDKSRIALVGRNGAGKSTLIKMIMGDESIDDGAINRKKGLTIGYLAQDTGLNTSLNIYDEMLSVFSELIEEEAKIHELEIQISKLDPIQNSEQFEKLSNTYDRIRNEFEQNNGYGYKAEIRGVLHGFGFLEKDYQRSISELSGGQKTQLALAKLLLEKPQLLILDEPTNHLDVTTIAWLEGYIQNYQGALLIISHDRYFLDKIVNEIYDLSNHTLTHYKGNYSSFIKQKDQQISTQLKEYDKQQKKIDKLETFIDKNIVRASSTKQAQARRKQLQKMDKIDKPINDNKVAHFSFTPTKQSGNNILKITDAKIGYPNKLLSQDVNLEIKKHQAVAIVGPNGVGKSTLLKSILGKIPFIDGKVQFGTGIETGYYDQEQRNLHSNKTVLNELWDDHPTTPEGDIRGILGSFLFSGNDVEKFVSDLSGGEKARLLLTKLSMRHDNFLILDEPTNHLDIDSREVLEKALQQFEGTILFVSHDRYFINQVATSVVELSFEKTTPYLGNYDYYLEKKEELLAIAENQKNDNSDAVTISSTQSTDKTNYQLNKENQKKLRKLNRKIEDLENQLSQLDEQKNQIEAEMASEENYTDVSKLSELQTQLDQITTDIVTVEQDWENASIELEEFSE